MPFRSGGKQVAIRNLSLQQRRPGLGRLRRGLGCACRTSLGQDSGDIFSPSYDPLSTPVISTGPVYGPPAPTPANIAFDQTVAAGSTPNPDYAFQPLTPAAGGGSGIIPVFGGSALAPLSMPGTFMQTTGPNAGAVVMQAAPGAALSPSFSTYLPYIVLGGGVLALLSLISSDRQLARR
jgi:hypothetical protein